jgi:hypothetical protein
MPLVSCSQILSKKEPVASADPTLITPEGAQTFKGTPVDSLKHHLGEINLKAITHFVTYGRWSMHDLLFYILCQTGPAQVDVATWSISEDAIRQIVKLHHEGMIIDVRFILDPRVKVRNPKPLQMLAANFPYKLIACHAKVTLIASRDCKISIISSANMTGNPRIERGCIFPFPDVYDFDKKWINDTFNER